MTLKEYNFKYFNGIAELSMYDEKTQKIFSVLVPVIIKYFCCLVHETLQNYDLLCKSCTIKVQFELQSSFIFDS